MEEVGDEEEDQQQPVERHTDTQTHRHAGIEQNPYRISHP